MMGISLSASLARLRGPVSPGSDQPLTTTSEVWAVSRFDQEDSTIENFWSEKIVKGATVTDEAGTRPYGSHAEPLFIRDFPRLKTNYGRAPQVVELFLSRSACANSDPMTANGHQYPKGCGAKLLDLAKQNSNIEFFVIHDVLYAGNPNKPKVSILTESKNTMARYSVIPNLHAFSFAEYQPYLLA
jgi:hypothetical protein